MHPSHKLVSFHVFLERAGEPRYLVAPADHLPREGDEVELRGLRGAGAADRFRVAAVRHVFRVALPNCVPVEVAVVLVPVADAAPAGAGEPAA